MIDLSRPVSSTPLEQPTAPQDGQAVGDEAPALGDTLAEAGTAATGLLGGLLDRLPAPLYRMDPAHRREQESQALAAPNVSTPMPVLAHQTRPADEAARNTGFEAHDAGPARWQQGRETVLDPTHRAGTAPPVVALTARLEAADELGAAAIASRQRLR
jgi:hypothetical protein